MTPLKIAAALVAVTTLTTIALVRCSEAQNIKSIATQTEVRMNDNHLLKLAANSLDLIILRELIKQSESPLPRPQLQLLQNVRRLLDDIIIAPAYVKYAS